MAFPGSRENSSANFRRPTRLSTGASPARGQRLRAARTGSLSSRRTWARSTATPRPPCGRSRA
eukprot:3381307-Lingulodinium_polyedra.AAC.1